MAEIASNVLHNVGNVLTSAVINAEQMREAVESSRIGRVKQLHAMLDEHRDDLVGFLTHDPRGSSLPDYFCGPHRGAAPRASGACRSTWRR